MAKNSRDLDIPCSTLLKDQSRLKALVETGQMGSPREEAFDRLTRLAAKILNVPLTIVSFISDDQQFFKSFHGLPEPWASGRVISIDNSVCQYTMVGEPLALEDVREYPQLASNPAVPALGLVAYLGIPMISDDGHNLGAFCAVDHKPRVWTPYEIDVLKELTYSVMSEVRLRMALEKLQKEYDVREQFVATLSHDLRSPLSIAHLSAQIIEEEFNNPETSKVESLRIQKSLSRADQLITGLLNEHRIAGGKDTLALAPVDLAVLIPEILEDFRLKHGPRFGLHLSQPGLVVQGNSEGLWRAIENLISNAIKYGSVNSVVSVGVTQLHDRRVEISVHNFGEMIPVEDQQRIFNPFHRGSATKAGGIEGWGLGLSLVKRVVEEHRGSVQIESFETEGTTFKILLPA
jgi:signal transduction histidine kinase